MPDLNFELLPVRPSAHFILPRSLGRGRGGCSLAKVGRNELLPTSLRDPTAEGAPWCLAENRGHHQLFALRFANLSSIAISFRWLGWHGAEPSQGHRQNGAPGCDAGTITNLMSGTIVDCLWPWLDEVERVAPRDSQEAMEPPSATTNWLVWAGVTSGDVSEAQIAASAWRSSSRFDRGRRWP